MSLRMKCKCIAELRKLGIDLTPYLTWNLKGDEYFALPIKPAKRGASRILAVNYCPICGEKVGTKK